VAYAIAGSPVADTGCSAAFTAAHTQAAGRWVNSSTISIALGIVLWSELGLIVPRIDGHRGGTHCLLEIEFILGPDDV
jgi:hypothetical protein